MTGYTITHRSDYGSTRIADSVLERLWDEAVREQMTLDESVSSRMFEREGRLYLRAA